MILNITNAYNLFVINNIHYEITSPETKYSIVNISFDSINYHDISFHYNLDICNTQFPLETPFSDISDGFSKDISINLFASKVNEKNKMVTIKSEISAN